jgi:hypothetical protein
MGKISGRSANCSAIKLWPLRGGYTILRPSTANTSEMRGAFGHLGIDVVRSWKMKRDLGIVRDLRQLVAPVVDLALRLVLAFTV